VAAKVEATRPGLQRGDRSESVGDAVAEVAVGLKRLAHDGAGQELVEG